MAKADQRFLGSNPTEKGTNFAIWAAAADSVILCFFDEIAGQMVETRHELVDRNGPIFHGYFEGIRPGQRYGYRISGPWDPLRGWRFNPNKLLIDPYAHSLKGDLIYAPEIYSHVSLDGLGSGDVHVMDDRDSAGFVPYSVVTEQYESDGTRIRIPWSQTVIYEAHVRGLTEFNGLIPENERGTYKALGHESTIAYLKNLGITALELLPIQASVTEPLIDSLGRINHWGYNPIAFTVPHDAYAATDDPISELRDSVSALHAAGIEVILDVVYNHTAEGGVAGPTFSFRGIDSKTFYRRISGDVYDDVTGCGNTVDASRPHVVRMIIDSLRWWCEAIGVDGFRFDLASALARHSGEIDGISALIVSIVSDPVLRERKLIAEPWDIRGYALGVFPYPWREWNDQYRDAVRKFWLTNESSGVGPLATRLSGSHDIFYYRGPTSSINFITAHDGFTLSDLVSYQAKHNAANAEHNRDGTESNHSWNVGIEGPTADSDVNEIRQRLKKSLMASLLLSAGIPMITMGDEVGRSQLGSNNSYSLPKGKRGKDLLGPDAFGGGWALSWVRDEQAEEMLSTTKNLISLRKKYLAPVSRTFFTGELDLNTSRKDLAWFDQFGREMDGSEWQDESSRFLGMYVEASADHGMLVFLNASHDPIECAMPEEKWGSSYRSVFDSSEAIEEYEPKIALPSEKQVLHAHAVQVWLTNRS